jgi:hypothetical protein
VTLDQFRDTLAQALPPAGLPPVLLALWYDGRGDWQAAHEIAQNVEDGTGAWVHAYLHRKEGDLGNAGYWYRRARRPVATGDLQQEWSAIVKDLLEASAPGA